MASKLLRVGLTGSRGFVGSHLKDALESLDRVRVIPLRRPTKTSTLNFKNLKRRISDLDVIFHLAGVNRGAEKEILEGNVMGTWNLLEALKTSGNTKAHLVFASSGQIYPASTSLIRENRRADPPTIYGVSKKAAEDLVRLSGFSFTSVRLSNVYGPRCRAGYNSVIATFCQRATQGQPLTLHGKGTQGRDFIFIEDVVNALLKAGIDNRLSGIYNLSSGRTHTLKQIVQRIRKRLPNLEVKFQPGEDTGPRSYGLDNSRFKNRFQWRPRVSLDQGLARTLQWFQER